MKRGAAVLAAVALLAGCAHHYHYRFPPSFAPPVGFVEEGVASWYGPGYHGNRTSNGELSTESSSIADNAIGLRRVG